MSDGIKKISENVIKPGRALTLTGRDVKDYDGIPVGTLRAIRDEKGLEYKNTGASWSKFDGEGILNKGTITTDLLANLCVTNAKIADAAVNTRTIADNAVVESKIANDAVTELKIKAQNVTTSRLKDRCVTSDKLADNSVITRTILDLNVTTQKLANYAVTEIKLADKSVSTQKIADKAITTAKLGDKVVMFDNIGDGQVYGAKIPNEGIEFRHLRANSVVTDKIAPGAVTTDKIANKSVTGDKIGDGSIGTIHLMDSCVTSVKIADAAIKTHHIKDSAITRAKLDSSLKSELDSAVKHDANGHAKVIASMGIGANPKSGYALSVDGNIMANKVYNAVYMDIAEAYVPGEELETGDIVCIKEDGKVYKADINSECIVGVISDQYAACYGATVEELESKEKVAVGLIGKVPVKVRGPVSIGQYIGSSEIDGVGITTTSRRRAVGKALETVKSVDNTDIHEVLCLIFPN